MVVGRWSCGSTAQLFQYLFDLFAALAAATAGLGEVRHFLDGRQLVFGDDAAHFVLGDVVAGAERGVLKVAIGVLARLVVLDRRFHRLAAHHAAMHLLRRKSAKVVGNLLVSDLLRLFERLADHHLRQSGTGRNRARTPERLELRLGDLTVRTKLELKLESVSACQRADCRRPVRILNLTHVSGIPKVVHHLLGVVPHNGTQLYHISWPCRNGYTRNS